MKRIRIGINKENEEKDDIKESIQWSCTRIHGLPNKKENNKTTLLSKGMSIIPNLTTKINMEGHVVVMYYDINKLGKGKMCITNNVSLSIITKLIQSIPCIINENDTYNSKTLLKKCYKNHEYITLFIYDWPQGNSNVRTHTIRQVYTIRN